MKTPAKIISIIFHPLLMPSLGFLILFNSGTYLAYLPSDYKEKLLIIVLVCTLVLPLSLIPFFLYRKIIFSVVMPEKHERYIPLVFTLFLYVFCFYMLQRIRIPPAYHAFCLGCVISVGAAFLITAKWKISTHMIGIGGLTGLVAYLIFYLQVNLELYLIFIILAGGLTGTSRIILDAHRSSEIYSGFLVGFITIPAVMFIY